MSIFIWPKSVRCHTETDEFGSDEPYFLVVAVNLSSTIEVGGFPVPIPAANVVRYGPLGDMDQQETRGIKFEPFWGLQRNQPAPIPELSKAVFVVGLMEQDDGKPEALRGIAAGEINGELFATLNLPPEEVAERLQRTLNSAMQTVTGFPDLDDTVGGPQLLRFTRDEINRAETGRTVERSLRYGGNGGDYSITFEARNRGESMWRFCTRCRGLFRGENPEKKGTCPGGTGGHIEATSMYFLPSDRPGPSGGQSDWHFCNRCRGLFWAGDPHNQGVCPLNHIKHFKNGPMYFPAHDSPAPGQTQWRFCEKCRVMFFNGEANKGICPVGGGHEVHPDSFNFVIDHEA